MDRTPKKNTSVRVAEVIGWLENIAPLRLAEEWDNCGLQVGSLKRPVRSIWVALDPLGAVIEAAVSRKVDLLITHHPLILRPLTRIDLETPAGRAIESAVAGRLTIYSAHTNLDSAEDGLNDILARRIGIRKPECLLPAPGGIDGVGLGRVGRLDNPLSVGELANRIKQRFGLAAVKMAGNPELRVTRAAVCSGGGSSLLDAFLESDAQVYISGDMRYHNARDVEAAGRALIDIGHFSSEHIVVEDLVRRLRKAAADSGWTIDVEACGLEQDPFITV